MNCKNKEGLIKQGLYLLLNTRGVNIYHTLRLWKAVLKDIIDHIFGKVTSISLSLSGSEPIHIIHNDGVQRILCVMRPRSDDASCLLLNELYELAQWFYPSINNESIVVDVGAHVGGYTIRACKKVKQVISIEPYGASAEILKQNIKLNSCNNVYILQKAISDRKGYGRLKIYPGQEAMSTLNEDGNIIVETDTLDNIIQDLGINRIDFLKIDIEGSEAVAIRGMKYTLKITKNIMIEVRPETEYVIKEIEKNSFKVVDCVDHGNIKNVFLRSIRSI